MQHFTWVTLLALSLALACASSSAQPKAPEPARASTAPARPAKMREPEWLPPQAREALNTRMQRHGEEMMYLTATVLTLNYEATAEIATMIAEEPRIGRPAAGEQGTLGALLPARFFDLQDELSLRATELASVAKGEQHDEIVRAYGRLAQTCVSCHALYLEPEGSRGGGSRDEAPEGEGLEGEAEPAPFD